MTEKTSGKYVQIYENLLWSVKYMSEEAKMRSSIFGGYKKKDVDSLMAELNNRIAEKETLIASLKEKTDELEKERAFISDALLKAKKEGERIISDAKGEAEERTNEAKAEIARLNEISDNLKDRIRALQADAEKVLEGYKNAINSVKLD